MTSSAVPDFPGIKTGGLMVRRGGRGRRDCGREWNRRPTPMANRQTDLQREGREHAAVFEGKIDASSLIPPPPSPLLLADVLPLS